MRFRADELLKSPQNEECSCTKIDMPSSYLLLRAPPHLRRARDFSDVDLDTRVARLGTKSHKKQKIFAISY